MARRGASRDAGRATLVATALALGSVVAISCDHAPPTTQEIVDYQRDVQPILAEHCFGCHGPDASTRAAGLRLDTFEDATADRGGGRFAIVPRDPDASLVVQRAALVDPAPRMPPPPALALTADELATIRAWIAAGAPYERHWAFTPITSPAVPGGADSPIDAFVREALAEEGLSPAPREAPAALVRRLSFDVRGLPPTPEEVDAFVADPSEPAYEALVDAWLASPAHAERLATDWMDYAGYGDSNGLHADDPRQAWPWRDWVIARFLENRPLDAMIVAQLAGDLLPDATDEDVLATGFLRLHPTTGEGGVDPDEQRFLHAMHRARTVGTQLFGLTVHCAQCHDHKYDPITQRDFHSLIACFDRVADQGLVTDVESEAPTLPVTSPLWPARRADIVARIDALEAQVSATALTPAMDAWRASLSTSAPRFVAPEVEAASAFGSVVGVEDQGLVRITGAVPVAETLTVAVRHDAPVRALRLELGEGRSALPPWISEITADVLRADGRERVSLVRAFLDDGTDVTDLVADGATTTDLEAPVPRAITLVPSAPIVLDAGDVLTLRLDQRHGRATVFGSLRVLVSSDVASILEEELRTSLTRPLQTEAERSATAARFAIAGEGSPVLAETGELLALRRELARGDRPVRTRVMREDDPDRRTYVRLRGQWAQQGEEVRCAVPATLRIDHPVDVSNRLELARFVVGDENPITARVLANHYFLLLTGRSLVATPDDWGTRGGTPRQRALLDWLATTLRAPGASGARWDLRAYLRLVLMSETYRQSSALTDDHELRDPLLGRALPRRLEAEMLRDQALAVSGLLVSDLGGSPAFVSHPDGLYEAFGDGLGALTSYPVDRSARQQHRRALYAFWRRSVPHPSLSLFDMPSRLYASAHRDETSTPTQALALLHDPLFVEAARVLAIDVVRASPDDVDAQIDALVRRVLARAPTDTERGLLRASYDAERAELEADPASARAILDVGESERVSTDVVGEAALTLLARALLSTSEAQTRP